MSIVLSGLLLGILVARVIGGIIAEYSSWRNVYYMAIGVQALTLAMLYWTLPDYPQKSRSLTYFGILTSMAKFAVTEPVLIQGSIMSMMPSECAFLCEISLT
jgi:predicted MFS family arabinose efflux permease